MWPRVATAGSLLPRYTAAMSTICPKCGYARQERDAAAYPGTCPACGIAYIKWQQARLDEQREEAARRGAESAENVLRTLRPLAAPAEPEAFHMPVDTVWRRVFHYICFMPSDGHIAAFWAHMAVFGILLLWGFAFLWHGLDTLWISRSFLHSINLPFHEYGHLMFKPFGTYMMFLGGSLFQILLPLILLGYFMVWQRDNFAAAMMLWWSGQNFIDVAPYIADAQLRALPLTTQNEDSHDWWNLLTMSGTLDHADAYASLCFTCGAGVMLLSYAWGAYLLSIEFRGRALAPVKTSEAVSFVAARGHDEVVEMQAPDAVRPPDNG